jgi:hypothetical protein
MLLHRFSRDHFAGVVPAKGEWVARLGAFIFDLGNVRKCAHRFFFFVNLRRVEFSKNPNEKSDPRAFPISLFSS